MDGSGTCTACGADNVEVNNDQTCADCAGGSMESKPAEESAPAGDEEAAS